MKPLFQEGQIVVVNKKDGTMADYDGEKAEILQIYTGGGREQPDYLCEHLGTGAKLIFYENELQSFDFRKLSNIVKALGLIVLLFCASCQTMDLDLEPEPWGSANISTLVFDDTYITDLTTSSNVVVNYDLVATKIITDELIIEREGFDIDVGKWIVRLIGYTIAMIIAIGFAIARTFK